MTLGDVSRSSH